MPSSPNSDRKIYPPVEGTAALILLVRRKEREEMQPYYVSRIWDHPAIPGPAFSLRKPDGETFEVALTEHGPTCTCPDSTYRERRCKHIGGLEVVGLLRKGG